MSEFEIFLNKARERENSKIKIAKINIENFGEVEFKKPSTKELLEYTDKVGKASKVIVKGNETIVEDTNLTMLLEASQELVYNSCPSLQKKEFREELFPNVTNYYSLPVELFGIDETIDLANKIVETFDGKKIREEIVEEIKN